jgi:chromosome segregation ATPase
LNNSNDLFLTFRKEMEDMSKKTKKLEKENEVLKRKVDARNSNIIKMADEREKDKSALKDTQKKNDKLTSIINQMQQQGRGIPQGMQGTVENGYAEGDGHAGDLDDREEESEYEDEDEYEEGDDEGSEDGEFDDDTEEEVHEPAPRTVTTTPRTTPYGPDPPPAPPLPMSKATLAAIGNQ